MLSMSVLLLRLSLYLNYCDLTLTVGNCSLSWLTFSMDYIYQVRLTTHISAVIGSLTHARFANRVVIGCKM